MSEAQDKSWEQAWEQKRRWAALIDRRVAHWLFLMSVCAVAALILYLIPVSGSALVFTSVGGTVCALLSLIFGLRAALIHSRAQKHLARYRQALDLPPPEEPAASRWEERILRWVFWAMTGAAVLIACGEIGLLWQEQPAMQGHLILLVVALVIVGGGFAMLRMLKSPGPSKEP